MIVPFCEIATENTSLLPELTAAFERVARSGRVLYGAELEAFEHDIAEWHGVKYAVGLASGTDSVELALRAVGCASAPVRVTAMTAVPTLSAIEAAHRRASGPFASLPTFPATLLDIDPRTRNATGADVHVQLYGLATDATGAQVEDIAHSMGATCNGNLAGTMARCGAGSAYPSKILGALGDGGFIITNDAGIAARARAIRHYGYEESGDIEMRGQNSRLCEMQAAFLRVKLPYVRTWIDRRRAIAKRYNDELRGRVTTPYEPPGHEHVHHVYVAEHPERDRIIAEAARRGVDLHVHYPKALHEFKRWRHLGQPGQFPHAERLARTCMSLPIWPFMRDEQQDHVIKVIQETT